MNVKWIVLAGVFNGLVGFTAWADKPPKPNIIYFVADDMGYAEVGFNGGTDVQTPNIDALAKRGAVLISFYSQPTSSSALAALLTGRYPMHTGTRQPLDGPFADENGEAVTRFKLDLPAIKSVFVVGRKAL